VVNSPTPSRRDIVRLQHLAAWLSDRAEYVRALSWAEAEAATERLAARLLEVCGSKRIEDSFFLPIPRGGLIVLGMLSYLLDLDAGQLPPSTPNGRPVVLVDDVALTGARLGQALDKLDATHVVAAHLASHPELQKAVASDPRVDMCVSALDLGSIVDELPQDKAEEFRVAWEERLPGVRFWAGGAELITFPWSEPDHVLWNGDTAKVERGWRLVSPERCLKNRAILGPPSPDREGRHLRFPDQISFGHFEDGLLVCRTDTEEVFHLDPMAAEMWGALGTLGSPEAVARHLTGSYDVSADVLSADVAAMATRLTEATLLEQVSGSDE